MSEELKAYIKKHLRDHCDTELDLHDLTYDAYQAYLGSPYIVDSFDNVELGEETKYIVHMGDMFTGWIKSFEELLLFFEALEVEV